MDDICPRLACSDVRHLVFVQHTDDRRGVDLAYTDLRRHARDYGVCRRTDSADSVSAVVHNHHPASVLAVRRCVDSATAHVSACVSSLGMFDTFLRPQLLPPGLTRAVIRTVNQIVVSVDLSSLHRLHCRSVAVVAVELAARACLPFPRLIHHSFVSGLCLRCWLTVLAVIVVHSSASSPARRTAR